MRIPIAKEGQLPAFCSIAAGFTFWAMGRRFGSFIKNVGLLSMTAGVGIAAFLRDPDRLVIPIENGILAPADGKVIRIEKTRMQDLSDDPVTCVSIFMGLFDCHINRLPSSGKITHKVESEGTFLAAWDERASEENRRAGMRIDGDFPVFVRQVAGLMARQIVSRPALGDTVTQGDRYGLIKFGSRVDVFFPADFNLLIDIGDYTFAGITALAEAPRKTEPVKKVAKKKAAKKKTVVKKKTATKKVAAKKSTAKQTSNEAEPTSKSPAEPANSADSPDTTDVENATPDKSVEE